MSPQNERLTDSSPTGRIRLILLASVLIFAGIALSYRVSYLQHRNDVGRLRDQVSSELDKVHGDLSRELYASVSLTRGLVSLVTIQGGISQAQFDAMAGALMSHTHIIRNVALAPDNVIRYICPLHGNESALGLDYLQNPAQRDAVLRAISEKRMVVAGPVDLVQGGTGIMGRTSIFPDGPSDRGGTSKLGHGCHGHQLRHADQDRPPIQTAADCPRYAGMRGRRA